MSPRSEWPTQEQAQRYAALLAERFQCVTEAVQTEDGWTIKARRIRE